MGLAAVLAAGVVAVIAAGLVVGLVAGLAVGFVASLAADLVAGLALSLVVCLAAGLAVGFATAGLAVGCTVDSDAELAAELVSWDVANPTSISTDTTVARPAADSGPCGPCRDMSRALPWAQPRKI